MAEQILRFTNGAFLAEFGTVKYLPVVFNTAIKSGTYFAFMQTDLQYTGTDRNFVYNKRQCKFRHETKLTNPGSKIPINQIVPFPRGLGKRKVSIINKSTCIPVGVPGVGPRGKLMIDALIAFDTTKIRRIKQALLIFCFIS